MLRMRYSWKGRKTISCKTLYEERETEEMNRLVGNVLIKKLAVQCETIESYEAKEYLHFRKIMTFDFQS